MTQEIGDVMEEHGGFRQDMSKVIEKLDLVNYFHPYFDFQKFNLGGRIFINLKQFFRKYVYLKFLRRYYINSE